jgi:hypothetical protein
MTADLSGLQAQTFARATAATAASYPPEHRMSGSQLAEYLDRRCFAVVASTRPDGRPHAAISGYVRQGTTFWLPTVGGSVRARNVRGHPWITLVVTEGDRGEHVAVIVEGPASVVPPEVVPPTVRAAVSGRWARAWLRLDAERLLSYAGPGTAAAS